MNRHSLGSICAILAVSALATVAISTVSEGLCAEYEDKPIYESTRLDSGEYLTTFYQNGSQFYNVVTDVPPRVMFVAQEDLTAEELESRMGTTTIYVEEVIGVMTTEDGDGVDGLGYYISYRHASTEIEMYDTVKTYLIYDPTNNYIDDIGGRCDYVIGRGCVQ